SGAATVNPAGVGTKAALHYVVTVPAGGSTEIRVRLAATEDETVDLGAGFDAVLADRTAEADEYFAALMPPGTTDAEAALVRAAVAGLMWGKQYYHFDVDRWLAGDAGSTPPAGHQSGRNSTWWHMHAADVISMPDPWEYPWFAAWDLAFHCVAIARVDPAFAKSQLLLLLRDWYLHPDGQIPAYEWAFGDVNPPVHAWAALRVFDLDGGTDVDFLSRVMHKLLLNFTWWVNRKDLDGNSVFEGGFLGLDNVGPFDRSAALPVAGNLQQSDATGWMGMYALNLLEIALRLARHDNAYTDIATKFFEHFAYIGKAAAKLWDADDEFYCDMLRLEDGAELPMRVFSVVGLVPLYATASMRSAELHDLPDLEQRISWFLAHKPEYASVVGVHRRDDDGELRRLMSLVTPERLPRILARVFDEAEFLSEFGVRSLSRVHATKPFVLDLDGQQFTVDYEPGVSRTATFGGNSNWRGPIWMPVNYMLIGALREFDAYLGDKVTFEYPTGSGTKRNLAEIVDDLSDRLVKVFLPGADGRRPIYHDYDLLATHPDWRDRIVFPEYFHGETGAGLGAWHQTGWTALVATLILSRDGKHPPRIR
ncbi:MAG TPA: glucosidase, partial [Micromonosporaceae bacterium]